MTPPRVLDEARQHLAEAILFHGRKRGPNPEGDLRGKVPHDIAISILMVGEEGPADEDDADAVLTRQVQEEERDEADQAIPEDEQPTRPQWTWGTEFAWTTAGTWKLVAEGSANGRELSLSGFTP